MVAKLEHRRRETHRQVIDFSAFVSNGMERKRSILPEGGSITIEVEQGLRVEVNEEEMETVLRNLFENAVLYSLSAPEITVCMKKAGKNCLLSFQDNGKGLDAKDMKKIFQMFYRVRHTGESIRGSGLGLYIVRSIISEHGGRIRVKSEGIGRGCSFLISLPLAR
jgi:signal transduction histidine kinase